MLIKFRRLFDSFFPPPFCLSNFDRGTCFYFLFLCRGALIGHPVENLRVVLADGASHAVDSSELAFKLAALYAFRQVQS